MGSEQKVETNEEALEQEQFNRLTNRIKPSADKRLQLRVRVGFAVALIMTGLLGMAGWRNAEKAATDADWVAHTHEVMAELEATNGHLADMEAGARTYAMSGQDSFLGSYEEGQRALGEDLAALSRLTADNPVQRQHIGELRPQIKARIETAAALVATRKMKTSTTAPSAQRSEKIMDPARSTIAQMEDEEKQLLAQRTQRTNEARRVTSLVVTLSSLVGVVFLAIAGFSVSRQVGISAQARAQVDALNAELERLVSKRTAALGDATGQLATVIQSAMDAIITFNDQQRIVLFNEASEKLFGCPASEALGQHIERFIPQRAGETAVASRAMGKTGAISARKADGTQFPVEASISQADAEGKKLSTVILRDITERRQAEEALHNQAEELSRQADELTRSQEEVLQLNAELEHRVAERTAELAATNKELEAFTYSVSHDLRAPLRHISGFTKILVEDFGPSLPAEAHRHLQRIEQGAHRMGLLVDELLNLTRVGRQSLAMQVTGLASIVKDVRSCAQILAAEIAGSDRDREDGERWANCNLCQG
jgi:PAS domain S-box-containing protein